MIWDRILPMFGLMYVFLVIVNPLTFLQMDNSSAESEITLPTPAPTPALEPTSLLVELSHLAPTPMGVVEPAASGRSVHCYLPPEHSLTNMFHIERTKTRTQKCPQGKLPSDPLRIPIVAGILNTEASSSCSSTEWENCECLRISHW